jgi:hypothetical protein
VRPMPKPRQTVVATRRALRRRTRLRQAVSLSATLLATTGGFAIAEATEPEPAPPVREVAGGPAPDKSSKPDAKRSKSGDNDKKRGSDRPSKGEEKSSEGSSGYSIPAYIVECESGGDYDAENPSTSASGAYQITDATWQAYGGQTQSAADAPKAAQDRVAAKIYDQAGPSQWTCA